MCNRIHEDSIVPKRKSGIGYKLFIPKNRNYPSSYYSIIINTHYKQDEDGWIRWDNSLFCEEVLPTNVNLGFCFFTSKKEAEKSNLLWNNRPGRYIISDLGFTEVHKIQYKKAFAKHMEPGFISPSVKISLCKEFKILD